MRQAIDHFRRNGVLLWTAVVLVVLSALLPLSYDESYWLGIWRMWSGGAVLYESALDNKSPLVYLFYGLLDAAPGPFEVARAFAFGVLILAAGLGAVRASENRRGTTTLIAVTMVVVGLFAELRLYTEIVAAPMVVASIRLAGRNRPLESGLLAVLATCITPLAAGVIVVSLWISHGSRRWIPALLATIGFAGLVVTAVLTVDNLRFGLVELNLASREALGTLTGGSRLQERILFSVVGALPVVAVGLGKEFAPRRWTMILISALPALAAGWFPHYWTIPILVALALDARSDQSYRQVRWLVWAALPVLTVTLVLVYRSVGTAASYERVVQRLEAINGSGWDFAQFDLQPHVTAAFPQRVLLRSPSINYLVWETSRSDQHRGELPALLADAEVLLEPGLEDQLEVPDSVAFLVPPYLEAIETFDCAHEVEHLVVHLRGDLCEGWGEPTG